MVEARLSPGPSPTRRVKASVLMLGPPFPDAHSGVTSPMHVKKAVKSFALCPRPKDKPLETTELALLVSSVHVFTPTSTLPWTFVYIDVQDTALHARLQHTGDVLTAVPGQRQGRLPAPNKAGVEGVWTPTHAAAPSSPLAVSTGPHIPFSAHLASSWSINFQ